MAHGPQQAPAVPSLGAALMGGLIVPGSARSPEAQAAVVAGQSAQKRLDDLSKTKAGQDQLDTVVVPATSTSPAKTERNVLETVIADGKAAAATGQVYSGSVQVGGQTISMTQLMAHGQGRQLVAMITAIDSMVSLALGGGKGPGLHPATTAALQSACGITVTA